VVSPLSSRRLNHRATEDTEKKLIAETQRKSNSSVVSAVVRKNTQAPKGRKSNSLGREPQDRLEAKLQAPKGAKEILSPLRGF